MIVLELKRLYTLQNYNEQKFEKILNFELKCKDENKSENINIEVLI